MLARLGEEIINRIKDKIKIELPVSLAVVQSEFGDVPGCEPPQSYFISRNNVGYRSPAVTISLAKMTFNNSDGGQQYVDADSEVGIEISFEDKELETLERKQWRYSQAAYHVLHDVDIMSSDMFMMGKIIVESIDYTLSQELSTDVAMFRKSVLITCTVKHQEPFN